MSAPVNIKRVYAKINGGSEVVATWDDVAGNYSVDLSAPAKSSWSQPQHKYNIELYAEDRAGNIVKMDTTDKTYGETLKIRVLETTKPVAAISSPSTGSVFGTNTVDIVMSLSDSGESGLNPETIEFKLNGIKVTSGLTWGGNDNSKTATYHATGLKDGSNTATLKVTDNDGNESTLASISFIVATKGPSLVITEPADNLLTNVNNVTIVGTSSIDISGVTVSSVTITVNDDEPITVASPSSFSQKITSLVEGSNTIIITARSSAGKETTVTLHITLDTTAPVISDVHVDRGTVNVGETIHVTFKVTDASST